VHDNSDLIFVNIFFLTILGAALGSFLAWLGRALMDRREMKARSACDACRRTLEWWELIPIFSYIGLGGKCSSCGVTIMVADWSMEVVGAVLFGLGALRFTEARDLLWWCILAFSSLMLFYIILRWGVVPRAFSVVVAFIAILATWSPETIGFVLLSGLLGAIFYFFLYTISRGRWVGDGDVALGFIAGAAVANPEYLGMTLLLAHVFGAVTAIIMLLLKKRQLTEALPMGAFLLPAMWVIVLWFGWIR
jgi:prepilin signal peptidase PulO-like enzyme (type II secretory pathway)